MSWKPKKEPNDTGRREQSASSRGRPSNRGRGRGVSTRGGRGRGRGRRGGRGRGRGRPRGRGRGRGRGSRGGRGRDRGRGGYRGRSRGRGSYRSRGGFRRQITDKQQIKKTSKPIITKDLLAVQQQSKPNDEEIEIIKETFANLTSNDIQDILLGESKENNKVIDHVNCISYNTKNYIDKIEIFIQFKVFSLLSVSTKAKILTALLITAKKQTIHKLLYDDKNKVNLQRYSVGEMAKVIQLLDAPRLTRQYLKKLQKFEKQKKKVQKQKINKLKTQIYNLQKNGDGTHNGSLSGNKQKFFVKWIKSIDSNVLSFFLVTFPKTNWRYICDLIHINPKDFQLPCFQKVIFNKQQQDDEKLIDEESLVFAAKKLNEANITAALTKHKYLCECYSFIRKKVSNLPDKAKLILSETAPLSDLLWWYDEFKIDGNNKDIENKICQRLETEKNIFSDNTNKSAYGKLMERLLKVLEGKQRFAPLLIKHIEERLLVIPRISNIDRNHEYRVAIFGDASASMEVAIKTASILSSLMSYALSSDLLFFNSQPFDPPIIPRNVHETIEVVNNTKAFGTTSMASALYPYYINKIKVDLFILVSDEDENRKYRGYYFAELFNLYKGRINSECKLFLVSFLKQGDKGKLFERCTKYDIICKDVKQIRLHETNPDTSKFDALLGIASLMLLSLKNASKSKIPQILNEILSQKYDINDASIAQIIYDYLRGCSRDSVLKMYQPHHDSNTNDNNADGKTGIKLTSKQIIAIPKYKMIIKCEMSTKFDVYQFIQCVQKVYGANNKVEISNVMFTDRETQLIEYQIVFTDENEANILHSKRKQLNHEIADILGVPATDLMFKNDKLCKPNIINDFILQLDSDSSHILCGACLIYDNDDQCIQVVHYGARRYNNILHSGDTKVNGKSVHKIRLNLSKLMVDKNIKQLFFTLCACGPSDLSEFKEPTILLYEETAADINLIRYEIDEAGKSRSVVMCRIFKNNNCWNLQALGYKQWHIQQSVCGSYQYAKETITKELQSLATDGTKGNDHDIEINDIEINDTTDQNMKGLVWQKKEKK